MEYKVKYVILILIVLFLCTAALTIPHTHAKYVYNYSLNSNLNIGYMVCDVVPDTTNPMYFEPQQDLLLKFKMKNFDQNGNINGASVNYYIKIYDDNNNEYDLEVARINDYEYITTIKDLDGNLVDEHGNIIDESGHIIEERNLSEQQLSQLIKTKKGFGIISLKGNASETEEKEIVLKINVPASLGNNFKYKIKVLAENILNGNIEKYKDFDFTITSQNSNVENPNLNSYQNMSNASNQVDIYGDEESNDSNQVDIYGDEENNDSNQVDIYEDKNANNSN